MDRLMKTPWFIKIIAFSLAALLFVSINFQPDAKKGSAGFSPTSKTSTETVENVEVDVYYDSENLVVKGVPGKVDVTLKGPKSIVLSAKNQRDFKVSVDLADAVIGEQKVPIRVENLSDKITAVVKPNQATVTVQEKITKEYSVSPQFNEGLLEAGYIAGVPTADPERVRITGAKDIMDQISIVRASIELEQGINETVEKRARVRALDKHLNNLDVSIEPSSVDVRIPIQIPSKKVSVIPYQTGTLQDGLEIKSININPHEIILYGKQSELRKIQNIRVPVNVSDIDSSTTFEQNILLPEGIYRASEPKVSVSVKTGKQKEELNPDDNKEEEAAAEQISQTFSSIKINPAGLPDDYALTFVNPSSGSLSITVTGPPERIKALKESDIQLSIDASKLPEGRSETAVFSNLPDDLSWKIPFEKAAVDVAKKEAN
ncbi:YbbR domain-containing protein [Peribacillus deserti]|uniref:YbbR domain-containing protein n=1 Tax=Peribacillus deserti TaxID=673318 RepID=A0ABS2QPH8_9BACI|nr:CdaR family protein [Peribacillus deserti]MBM7694166.1 YbbR domain-containing protein [Peribacillus deserti]